MKQRILQAGAFLALWMLIMAVAPIQSQASSPAQTVAASIRVPEGFEITVFADNVPGARSLEWTPNGTLFVGTRQAGLVYALRDDDFNGVADGVLTIAQGLNSPNGVAFVDGSLYVAEINRILRYDNIEDNLFNPPAPVVVNDSFPTEQHHGWKFIRLGPDGKLYIPVGAPCNVCETVDPRYGSIMRMNLDGSDLELYVVGVRNTVGFDWHPETNELWFTDNGTDNLGDTLPPDELNRVSQQGLHFGFPYCHGGSVLDPQFGVGRICDDYTAPVQPLGARVAALGMRFYTGEQFPPEYDNQVFIAEHGSWGPAVPVGYRISLVNLDENGNATSYSTFADGWLDIQGNIIGRPVDIEQLPDGSLLVSDDAAGAIYRIRYTLPRPEPTPTATTAP